MVFTQDRIKGSMLLVIMLLALPLVGHAAKNTDRFSFSQAGLEQQESDPTISWTMDLDKTGLKSIFKASFEKPEVSEDTLGEIGWEYRVEIDGISVLQEFLTDTPKVVEQIIPLERVLDGKHVATLTVRDFEGKLHILKRELVLNSTPKITATIPEEPGELIDPIVTFSFISEREGLSGIVDVYLDTRPLKTINIIAEQNNTPVPLSQITGLQMYSADLTPGNHLLTIVAHSLTGGSATETLPITGSVAPPEIKVLLSSDNTFDSLEILFPMSSTKIVGTAEIFYNHSIILFIKADQPSLSITRAELLEAFKKHNIETGAPSSNMVISTRSANQIENWQTVLFK